MRERERALKAVVITQFSAPLASAVFANTTSVGHLSIVLHA